jgi:hypothetical protein
MKNSSRTGSCGELRRTISLSGFALQGEQKGDRLMVRFNSPQEPVLLKGVTS